MAHGKEQRVWRCIGRIEHRCTEAIGVHENKLQEAVCRCLSSMMQNSDEVLELCKQNLQYAFTGDQSALDTVALENQIRFEYSAPVEHPGRLRLNTLVAFG